MDYVKLTKKCEDCCGRLMFYVNLIPDK